MTDDPGFDPYLVLGVAIDADDIAIQLAYRARIRSVHPDIAGTVGLAEAKRLNVARDWLLDPILRARIPRAWPQPPGRVRPPDTRGPRPVWTPPPTWRTAQARPAAFDLGLRGESLRAFLAAIRGLSRDERARVNHSLGDTRPVFFGRYTKFLDIEDESRSRALRDAVSTAWTAGIDEPGPSLYPLGRIVPAGFHVANAYAQWMLLGDVIRRELADAVFRTEHVIDTLAARSIDPWEASVGRPRYGLHGSRVTAMLRSASTLQTPAAARLAHAWRRDLARDGRGEVSENHGPGVWLPVPPGCPEPLKVSGYVAAVDASRVAPPTGLAPELVPAFRFALRLTAHVTALGSMGSAADTYLRPWREAVGRPPAPAPSRTPFRTPQVGRARPS